jgi:methylmalonic acid semialdehyde dehydrogenase
MSAEKKAKVEDGIPFINNFIGNKWVAPISGEYLDVDCPHDGKTIARVALSGPADLDHAVQVGQAAYKTWSAQTVKQRVQLMLRFHALMRDQANEIAQLIMREHGKTQVEALGDVAKGNETVEYACSMPQLIAGRVLEVSRGVECRDYRESLGVVASIVPFNFPCMVPMWTMPIALACGNCVILKPSEKVPMTMAFIMDLFVKAGFPSGVVQIVNGTAPTVLAICDHPGIPAVSFVGSSKVAEIVAHRSRLNNKRVLALGGAKNHLVALPDCNIDMTSTDVVNSFTGCSGQRCMAASVLLTVGPMPKLIAAIVQKAAALSAGAGSRDIGPVIDRLSLDKILGYIGRPEHKLLLDGRGWAQKHTEGYWVGPTVLLHTNSSDAGMREEIFGPVLSIYECKDRDEALAIENANPYGNAACVYTSQGGAADWFCKRFSAGMCGVNVGVPVPREPFPFGGWNRSRFGDFDITADGGIEFFTRRKKITQKWNPPEGEADWMS